MLTLVYLFSILFPSTYCLSCDFPGYSQLNRVFTETSYGDYNYNVLMSLSLNKNCVEMKDESLLKVLAAQYVIQKINADPKLLKNITLGYKIDDACLNVPFAMRKGIDIVQTYRHNQCIADNNDTCSSNAETKDSGYSTDITAVLGGSLSFISIPLANLFTLHEIPIISAESSSPLLGKANFYQSFYRTIPPDTYTIQVIMDLVLHFNWTYIYAVGSDDDYGKVAITELKRLAALNNVCITGQYYIPFESKKTQDVAEQIAKDLEVNSKAVAVVMFNYANYNGDYIIKEADKLNLSRMWITGDSWNPAVLKAKDMPIRQLQNIISISWKLGETSSEFVGFIENTVRHEIKCNRALLNYVMHKYNCLINDSNAEYLVGHDCYKNNDCNVCNVSKSKVIEDIKSNNINQVNNFIDAIYAVSHGIESIIKTRCPNSTCKPLIQPSELTKSISKVSFLNQRNQLFEFDKNGDPKTFSYLIEQIQVSIDNVTDYVAVGEWSSEDRLNLNLDKISWLSWPNQKAPKSLCSIDCEPGEYMTALQSCCWICERCPADTYSDKINSIACYKCDADYYTDDRITCKRSLISFLNLSNVIGIAILLLCGIGTLTVLSLSTLFSCNNTIKARCCDSKAFIHATNALLFFTFVYSALHVVNPNNITCQIQLAYFHLLLISYNSLLLVKNSSVSHFLSKYMNKKNKVWFVQVLLFLLIVFVELSIVITWILTSDRTFIELDASKEPKEYFKKCVHMFDTFHIMAYAFPSLILLIATVQNIAERKTRLNNGESRHFMFTCYSFDIINIAYFITLNNVSGKYQDMVVVFTIIIYGYAYISCMIIPKLYMIFSYHKHNKQQSGVINIGFDGGHSNTPPVNNNMESKDQNNA